MYRYVPLEPKKKERLLALLCLLLTAIFFVLSGAPRMILSTLLRFLGCVHLVLFCGIVIFCLSHVYHYCIEMREDRSNAVPDLVILQYRGRRMRTVCRISVLDVREVRQVTREARRALAVETRGARVYRYYDRIRPENLYLLTVTDGDCTCCLYMMADERLLSYFTTEA